MYQGSPDAADSVCAGTRLRLVTNGTEGSDHRTVYVP